MSIYEKLQDGLNDSLTYSIETSRQLLKKAKETAAEFEEVSILKIDLRHLNTRKKELISELGVKGYEAFIVNGKKSLSLSFSGVKQILEEIEDIDKRIVMKEDELKQSEKV